MFCAAGIKHFVSVATGYGKDVMSTGPDAGGTKDGCAPEILTGRMDRDEMEAFFREKGFTETDLVIDATHPYAAEATANIKAAAEAVKTGYIRVARDNAGAENEQDFNTYESICECASAIDELEGNILLTTGSKELHDYCANVSDKTREHTYVRVIPSAESLSICSAEGISHGNIIAMQGPFSYELNKALMEQYDIAHIVTKESGTSGGFGEKIRAARSLGVKVHVIKRPDSEQGVDMYEAYRAVTGQEYNGGIKRNIILAGYGPGGTGEVSSAVEKAIKNADAVFGASRLLAGVRAAGKYEMYLAKDIIPVLENDRDIINAVILFTGDCGYYSGAKAMLKELGSHFPSDDIRVLPGISSLAYLAAALGESYDDAALFSLHGRKNGQTLNELVHLVKHERKVFVLLSGAEDIRDIGSKLMNIAPGCRLFIGKNLSYDDENIECISPEEAASYENGGTLTALIVNDDAAPKPIIRTIADDDLIRSKTPMTKECIRHEVIRRLGIKKGDVVYDIGGGTGSVAIEAALLDPSVKVYTFEKDDDACGLIEQNILKFNAGNVTLVKGTAPECLKYAESPDCAFIGGSGGMLSGIIETLKNKKGGIRVVITAVTLETMEAVNRILKENEITDAGIIQMSVSEAKGVGSYHLMQAQNPVMIYSFTL